MSSVSVQEVATDLRGFVAQAEERGELKRVDGAHWNLEIGAITELVHHHKPSPAVLFDHIPDYPAGYRVLINSLGSARRIALATGLPADLDERALMAAWHEKQHSVQPVEARVVADGPVLENVMEGDDIDLLRFPTPFWHERDGGRYIGTGSVDVTRDPDDGSVNLGTYRVMIRDRRHAFFYISPGKHGRIHRDKYFTRQEPCPVVVSVGHDPLIFLAGSLEIPLGLSEYEWIGGVRGAPVEVIRGKYTGLPFPANAEIVIEGFARHDFLDTEGPFGEWTGYYASDSRPEPVIEVKAVYHRNNPIMLGSPPGKPPSELTYYRAFTRSSMIREELAKAGVPDVTGVWCHEVGGARLFVAVSIKQRYPGHARQAALVATACHGGAYLGRYTVVVDDDIDVMDLNEVMWAVCTRSDPVDSIDIIRRTWSGPLDPRIDKAHKGHNSRAIIDATRPWEWRDEFPPVASASAELLAATRSKWAQHLFGGEA